MKIPNFLLNRKNDMPHEIHPTRQPTHHNKATGRMGVENEKIRQGNESTLTNGTHSKSSLWNSPLGN